MVNEESIRMDVLVDAAYGHDPPLLAGPPKSQPGSKLLGCRASDSVEARGNEPAEPWYIDY